MLSRGVPMVVAGDEFDHTQNGNNNPWALTQPHERQEPLRDVVVRAEEVPPSSRRYRRAASRGHSRGTSPFRASCCNTATAMEGPSML